MINENLGLFFNTFGEVILAGSNERYYNLSDFDYSLYLLPLLERKREDFIKYLAAHEKDISDVKTIIDRLLKFPFQNKMEYWCEMALLWIDFDDLQSNLWLYAIDDSWMTQPLRHKILRMRKKFKLGN